jgi:hypothetical protein
MGQVEIDLGGRSRQQHGWSVKRLWQRWRVPFVRCCPNLAAFLFLYGWLPRGRDPLWVHLIVVLFGAVLFPAVILLVYLVTILLLSRLNGKGYDVAQHRGDDLRVTSAVLLILLTYMLATHWVSRKVEAIGDCMRHGDFVMELTPYEGSGGDLSQASRLRASQLLQWCRNAGSEDAWSSGSDDEQRGLSGQR